MAVEARHLLQLALAMLTLSAFVLLYAKGGGDHRTLYRRLLGSFVYTLGCTVLVLWSHRWSWFMLLGASATFGWLTMGYGADTLPSKLKERALYGLVGGLTSGIWLLPLGLWPVWLFQTAVAVAASVFYGVVNPQSRVGEEGAIALFMTAAAPFALIG